VGKVRSLIGKEETVMVVLDSDHHAEHVLNELRIYGPMVTVGNYLIAEDTNVNGHPVRPDFGPGPWEAVQTFLEENNSFAVDTKREKLLLTFNPGGYLIRTR
jgi:cephalosporin hydroxylase